MEFGRVTNSELESVDLILPPDPPSNKKILKGKPVQHPKIYMGCAKWGREEWVGKIYPNGTREKAFLDHYVKHYNSIELNAMHHKLYGPIATARWASKAKGKDFLFCPKMYKGITHSGKLGEKKFFLTDFIRAIKGFEKNLGPVFIQVNESFSPKRKEELYKFLQGLPDDVQWFMEVRHPDWFAKKDVLTELFALLSKLKIGAVITDTAGRRDCVHMQLTIPKAFIRFTGNSLHITDYSRIDDWVSRIKLWLDSGLKELYFFMHMHDEAFSPELSVYLAEQLNKKCSLKVQVPKFVET